MKSDQSDYSNLEEILVVLQQGVDNEFYGSDNGFGEEVDIYIELNLGESSGSRLIRKAGRRDFPLEDDVLTNVVNSSFDKSPSKENLDEDSIKVVEHTLEHLLHPVHSRPIEVGIVSAKTSSTGSRVEEIAGAILDATNSGKYDIVVAPEYNFLTEKGPLTVEQRDEYREIFQRASENGTLIIPGTFVWKENGTLKNTAYLFYNGEEIFEYDKVKDGGESSIAFANKLTEKLGKKKGVFNWLGLDLGIEICADRGYLYQCGERDMDLAFLISCGMKFMDYTILSVRENGYVVHCDGRDLINEVFHKVPGEQVETPYMLKRLEEEKEYFSDEINDYIKKSNEQKHLENSVPQENSSLKERLRVVDYIKELGSRLKSKLYSLN